MLLKMLLSTILSAFALFTVCIAAPSTLTPRGPPFGLPTDPDVIACAKAQYCTQAAHHLQICLELNANLDANQYEFGMLSCLCYGKPGVPSMRFNLPNCVACVEKGNDVISSKIGPDYFNAFCFDRTITIQQMVLGIYKLGAEQQFPLDLPFATLCHGDPKDLPWPPYTFKRDIEAGSSDKLQSRDDQADQFSALADTIAKLNPILQDI